MYVHSMFYMFCEITFNLIVVYQVELFNIEDIFFSSSFVLNSYLKKNLTINPPSSTTRSTVAAAMTESDLGWPAASGCDHRSAGNRSRRPHT